MESVEEGGRERSKRGGCLEEGEGELLRGREGVSEGGLRQRGRRESTEERAGSCNEGGESVEEGWRESVKVGGRRASKRELGSWRGKERV
eukprot:2633611-Rhodomonas_salina.1